MACRCDNRLCLKLAADPKNLLHQQVQIRAPGPVVADRHTQAVASFHSGIRQSGNSCFLQS